MSRRKPKDRQHEHVGPHGDAVDAVVPSADEFLGRATDRGAEAVPVHRSSGDEVREIVTLGLRWEQPPNAEASDARPRRAHDWTRRGSSSGFRDWHGLPQFAEQFRDAISLPEHAPAAANLAAAASRIAAVSPVPVGEADLYAFGSREARATNIVVAGAGRGSLAQFTALGMACSFARWGQPTLVIAPGVHPAAKKPRLSLTTLDQVASAIERRCELPVPVCLSDQFPRTGGRVDALFGQGWAALAWLVQSSLFETFLAACSLRYQRVIWTLGSVEEAMFAAELLTRQADHLVVTARRGWADLQRLERLLRSGSTSAIGTSGGPGPIVPDGVHRWAVWYR